MATELKDRQGNVVQRDGKDIFISDAESAVKGVNLERRDLTIIGSNETKDRDGDIIMLKGWNFENYRKNPVFLWGHDYSSVPIGACKRLTRKKEPAGLEFQIRFPTEQGVYPFADMVLQLFADNIIKASSVGFIPKKWEPLEKDEGEDSMFFRGRRFLKQELLELSGCAVPSNPDAVTNMLMGSTKFTSLPAKNQEGIIHLLLYGPSGVTEEKEIVEAVQHEVQKEVEFIDEMAGSMHFVPQALQTETHPALAGDGAPPPAGRLEIVNENQALLNIEINSQGNGHEPTEKTKVEEVEERFKQVETWLGYQEQELGESTPVILHVDEGTGQIVVTEYELEPKEPCSHWDSILNSQQPTPTPSAPVQPNQGTKEVAVPQNPPEQKYEPILTKEQGERITSTVWDLRSKFSKILGGKKQ